jgi:hypothetical protein
VGWGMVSARKGAPYAVELHIRGVLHLQIERSPRWLFSITNTVLWTALSTWILTR